MKIIDPYLTKALVCFMWHLMGGLHMNDSKTESEKNKKNKKNKKKPESVLVGY